MSKPRFDPTINLGHIIAEPVFDLDAGAELDEFTDCRWGCWSSALAGQKFFAGKYPHHAVNLWDFGPKCQQLRQAWAERKSIYGRNAEGAECSELLGIGEHVGGAQLRRSDPSQRRRSEIFRRASQ